MYTGRRVYFSSTLWQSSGTQDTRKVKSQTAGGLQHIICSLLIILGCLSNKEGQCDRHILSLFHTTKEQKR